MSSSAVERLQTTLPLLSRRSITQLNEAEELTGKFVTVIFASVDTQSTYSTVFGVISQCPPSAATADKVSVSLQVVLLVVYTSGASTPRLVISTILDLGAQPSRVTVQVRRLTSLLLNLLTVVVGSVLSTNSTPVSAVHSPVAASGLVALSS